jgi:hypothetical protein
MIKYLSIIVGYSIAETKSSGENGEIFAPKNRNFESSIGNNINSVLLRRSEPEVFATMRYQRKTPCSAKLKARCCYSPG